MLADWLCNLGFWNGIDVNSVGLDFLLVLCICVVWVIGLWCLPLLGLYFWLFGFNSFEIVICGLLTGGLCLCVCDGLLWDCLVIS